MNQYTKIRLAKWEKERLIEEVQQLYKLNEILKQKLDKIYSLSNYESFWWNDKDWRWQE